MEDSIFPGPGTATDADRLFIVCDGMGGHAKGEIASKLACDNFSKMLMAKPEMLDESALLQAFSETQDLVDQYTTNHPEAEGMGTTIVLAAFTGNGLFVLHCGDSRLVHIRESEILFKTTDHSMVYDWVKQGRLTEQEADRHPMSNIITRAIQGRKVQDVQPDIRFISDLRAGDYIFMCSDGVIESVSTGRLVEILQSGDNDETKMETLRHTCEAHSKDNYSAYLLRITSKDVDLSRLK